MHYSWTCTRPKSRHTIETVDKVLLFWPSAISCYLYYYVSATALGVYFLKPCHCSWASLSRNVDTRVDDVWKLDQDNHHYGTWESCLVLAEGMTSWNLTEQCCIPCGTFFCFGVTIYISCFMLELNVVKHPCSSYINSTKFAGIVFSTLIPKHDCVVKVSTMSWQIFWGGLLQHR
jgi:hypothetical protein